MGPTWEATSHMQFKEEELKYMVPKSIDKTKADNYKSID